MPPAFDLFLRFGTALAIGFLIGLQREFAHSSAQGESITAGERTTSLLSLGGAVSAMLSDLYNSPVILIGFLAITGIFTAIGYFSDSWKRERIGITSEIAILISVMIGALCYKGELTLAVALGIATTVILSLKVHTDRFVRALTREELFAALQLAVISAIVLPVLPNQGMGDPPFDVLNPFNAWLMVVFISGINFLGYVFARVVGQQGIELSGFVGGLVSSTAVTLGFTERSKREPGLARSFAFAIIIAWTVMFARVLVEVRVLNRELFGIVWLPVTLSGVAGLVYVAFLYLRRHSSGQGNLKLTNPLDLRSAIRFGLLFVVILLVSRTAQLYFGETGILISSLISGLADVDAITLSVSELSRNGGLDLKIASQAILFAAAANTIAKGGMVLLGGDRQLRRVVFPGLAAMLAVILTSAFLI
ncbi:MAG TPA: MgtC/SapB family protein [Chloroflexi bacterium]|nr:MgtC/SapB family protein [Chloroflexota bacterium]